MDIPTHIAAFWRTFVESRTEDPTAHFYEAFHFSDSEASANELAELVLAGTKRATAALVWSFEDASVPMPKVGDLSVVTNWAKAPLCVIETQRVDVVAYDEVSAEFAATEGEGDGSLGYWREAHWAYFGRECERIGRSREPKMPVVCERFEVVFGARNKIRLAPYSAQWPRVFEAECQILRSALPVSGFRIEHVGSTAIPDAVAKPIVDLLVGAASLSAIEDRIPALEAIGYRYVPAYEVELPQRRYFVKPGDRPHRFHLHAVETGSAFWREHLLFRDALRADGGLLAQYCALKLALAARFGDDREGYTRAKRPFIRSVVERARASDELIRR